MMKDFISIIVTTYNRPDALNLVLNGLSQQDDEAIEIVIADDGNACETLQVVKYWQKKCRFRIKHAWQPDLGFRLNKSRNNGIKLCSGDYLIFLDGDCIPRASFVRKHRALRQKGWVVAGNRCLLSPELTDQVLGNTVNILTWSPLEILKARINGGVNRLLPLFNLPVDASFRYRRPKDWSRLRGCNFGVFLDDVVKVDGFDETYTGWGYDDSDFAVRLVNAGVSIKCGTYATAVYHLFHEEKDAGNISSNNYKKLRVAIDQKKTLPSLGLSNTESEKSLK